MQTAPAHSARSLSLACLSVICCRASAPPRLTARRSSVVAVVRSAAPASSSANSSERKVRSRSTTVAERIVVATCSELNGTRRGSIRPSGRLLQVVNVRHDAQTPSKDRVPSKYQRVPEHMQRCNTARANTRTGVINHPQLAAALRILFASADASAGARALTVEAAVRPYGSAGCGLRAQGVQAIFLERWHRCEHCRCLLRPSSALRPRPRPCDNAASRRTTQISRRRGSADAR